MTEDIYKKLYEQNSEGIRSVIELKSALEKHIEGDKLRDYKLDNLIDTVTVSNGKPSLIKRVETVERYVAYVIGASAILGVIWGVVVFVAPLIIGRGR